MEITEQALWQSLGKEELDHYVRLMIWTGLIRRRKRWDWVLVKGRGLVRIRGSVEKRYRWEYKVTRPGELVLKLLMLLTRYKVLPE